MSQERGEGAGTASSTGTPLPGAAATAPGAAAGPNPATRRSAAVYAGAAAAAASRSHHAARLTGVPGCSRRLGPPHRPAPPRPLARAGAHGLPRRCGAPDQRPGPGRRTSREPRCTPSASAVPASGSYRNEQCPRRVAACPGPLRTGPGCCIISHRSTQSAQESGPATAASLEAQPSTPGCGPGQPGARGLDRRRRNAAARHGRSIGRAAVPRQDLSGVQAGRNSLAARTSSASLARCASAVMALPATEVAKPH
jgi:hypothetical protein